MLHFELGGPSVPGLFASGPQISPTGVLSFTPAPGAQGTAVVPVRLVDDGGTANGGHDTSTGQLTITIDNADAPPSIALLRRLHFADGRGTLSLLLGDDDPAGDLDLTGTASRGGVDLLVDGQGAHRTVIFSGLAPVRGRSSPCGCPTASPPRRCVSASRGAPPAPTPCGGGTGWTCSSVAAVTTGSWAPRAPTCCRAAAATTSSAAAPATTCCAVDRARTTWSAAPATTSCSGAPARTNSPARPLAVRRHMTRKRACGVGFGGPPSRRPPRGAEALLP